MSIVTGQDELSELDSFFEYLFGQEDGFVYIARKDPNDGTFGQTFIPWPEKRADLPAIVLNFRANWEVYVAPALFDSNESKKAQVKGSRVFWCEFDGVVPDHLTHLPQPTLKIQSSGEGHEHWYWRLDTFVDADSLDIVNRAITYMLGADTSGWDASQILRPPFTFNHKRKKDVKVIFRSDTYLNVNLFHGLPQPPEIVEVEQPEEIPECIEVISKHSLPDFVMKLFKEGSPDRSSGLMNFGYLLAEHNLSNEEMLAMLLNADERWGKFAGRSDRLKRLLEIITRARQKYPYRGSGAITLELDDEDELSWKPMGFLDIVNSKVILEWIWDGLLQRDGYLLLSGPSAIGKTQISIDAACHFALGKPYLERHVKQAKVGFVSLEMNQTDLQVFMKTLAPTFTEDELQTLNTEFLTLPFGEEVNFSDELMLKKLEEFVGDNKLSGIIIDSLGDATSERLTDEDFRRFFGRMQKLRKKLNFFMWLIHHNRKATGENKRPNKLSDVYGSQYITSKATTVLLPYTGQHNNSVQINPVKVRLSAAPAPFHVLRDQYLHFTTMTSNIASISIDMEEGHSETQKAGGQSPTDQSGNAASGTSGTSQEQSSLSF